MTVRNNQGISMSKRISATFAISACNFVMPALAISMIAISSAYAEQRLNNVSVVQTAPTVTQLRLGFSETPALPTAYQLNDPSRLVLDFEKVQNGLSSRFTDYNIGMIKEVTALNNDSTTRMIVGLKQPGNYTTVISGNDLLLTLTEPKQAQAATRATTIVTPGRATGVAAVVTPIVTTPVVTPIVETSVEVVPIITGTTTARVPANTVPADTMIVRVNPLLDPRLASAKVAQQYSYDGLSALNFVAGSDGGGDVSIALTNDAIPVDVQRQGNKLVVRMTGSTIPRNLLRRLNINSGLVAGVDTKNQGQNGVITINMSQDYEYQAYQSGNQLTISIKKPELLREPTLEEKVYTGEPLSMEFQDVEIRSVLDILAQFTDMNVVASDSVAGNITLRLINVPWDQALDIILKSKNLGKRENGNVILVAPSTELAEQEARELEAQQAVEAFSPLRTEYIRLSYARAEEVLTLISDGSGPSNNSGVGGGVSGINTSNSQDNNTLLSNRGTVTIDKRTNTLIVKDVANSIENIRTLISKIDIPVRQVMIEARIVSATDTFSKEIGVSWGILSNGAANNRSLLVGGSQQTITDLKDFDIQSTTINGQTVTYPSYNISRPDNLNVDLGVSNPAGRIAFGLLGISDFMLDLELSAMQAENRGEVISTPKILTADKQTAKISSGTQIPYPTESEGGGTTIEFKEALLSLEATPNITPDGKIGLKLDIKNASPNPNGSISEDAVDTNIIVEDGQTIVLGGVFRNQKNNEVEKVPFLGDLPYIGKAFRRDLQRNDKQELLIFITTKLVNDGISHLD